MVSITVQEGFISKYSLFSVPQSCFIRHTVQNRGSTTTDMMDSFVVAFAPPALWYIQLLYFHMIRMMLWHCTINIIAESVVAFGHSLTVWRKPSQVCCRPRSQSRPALPIPVQFVPWISIARFLQQLPPAPHHPQPPPPCTRRLSPMELVILLSPSRAFNFKLSTRGLVNMLFQFFV